MTRRLSSAAALLVATALAGPATAQTRRIVIDPGHGGQDPGGVGTGLQEKNVVLDVGRRFKQLLDDDTADPAGGGSWTALLVRDDDTFVSLAGRAAFANAEDADRFMSIHSNAFGNSSANGTETFSFREGTTGAALRDLVQDEMIAAWGRTDRGNKVANFAVLRETAMPAELHELAFITNAADAAFLASAEERQRAAEAHLRAIQRHFGLQPYIPSAAPTTGELAGRVVDDLGPVAGAAVEADGGPSATSAEDGSFLLLALAPGARTLRVAAEAHEPAVVTALVTAAERGELEIVLGRIIEGGGESDAGPGGEQPPPGGTDDGGDEDGGDASGCGCRAERSSPLSGALPLLLALAALARRRR